MMKALIIGAESFTGQHLSSFLRAKGYDVYGTTLVGSGHDQYFTCDITDKSSIKSIISTVLPDVIVNLAGISFVGTAAKELFYRVNLFAVENILESIVEIDGYKPKKVILASSATVYGNQENTLLDESMCPAPLNHYGFSKFAMEQIARTYFDKLDIVVVRPFNYTGVGQEPHFLIPKIVSHFKDKKAEIELGNIDVFREFNDVDYVCDVYEKLLRSDVKSEIVNICSNRVIALKEVIDMMNEIAGYEIAVRVNPAFVRQNEITKLSGSTTKLFALIGEIQQEDFKQCLRKMYHD